MTEQADQPEKDSPATELYAQLEADTTTTESPHERAATLRRVADLHESEGAVGEARVVRTQAALFDFATFARGERRQGTDARFFPLVEYANGSAYPVLDAFGDEAVGAIDAWFASTANPIHRARCADFLWVKRKDHRAALAAIDAYLAAADIYLANCWYPALSDAIDRAAELALKLNHQQSIDRAQTAAFRVAGELVHDERHPVTGLTRDILGTLHGFGNRLTDAEWESVVVLIEECVAAYDHDGTGKRGFLELLSTVESSRGRTAEAEAARRRIAESIEAEAHAAMKDRGALVGTVIYRESIQAWSNVGDGAKVDELKQRLAEAVVASEAEMKRTSTSITIPKEEFERRTNVLLSAPLDDALAALGRGEWAIPNVGQVRETAANLRDEFPLQWLVTRVTVKDGRVIDAPSTEEETERASFAHQYVLDLGMRRMELSLMLDRLEEEKGLDTATMVNLLREGGLVDDDTLETISVGFDRYFAKDYVSAQHILVPQLEDILRGFLVPLGVATMSMRDGVTREKPLDVVLQEPKLTAVLGEDLVVFLEMLYTDQLGANMRNETAHGLIKAKHCTRERLHHVLYCYITLAKFTVIQKAASEDEPQVQDSA